MSWIVDLHPDFKHELLLFDVKVREQVAKAMTLIADEGPALKRPHADTLYGSKYSNMKEYRFFAKDGVWRIAFAFDPQRSAILLVAADKAGVSQNLFYKQLINKADLRFTQHLEALKEKK